MTNLNPGLPDSKTPTLDKTQFPAHQKRNFKNQNSDGNELMRHRTFPMPKITQKVDFSFIVPFYFAFMFLVPCFYGK